MSGIAIGHPNGRFLARLVDVPGTSWDHKQKRSLMKIQPTRKWFGQIRFAINGVWMEISQYLTTCLWNVIDLKCLVPWVKPKRVKPAWNPFTSFHNLSWILCVYRMASPWIASRSSLSSAITAAKTSLRSPNVFDTVQMHQLPSKTLFIICCYTIVNCYISFYLTNLDSNHFWQ